jgi:hypothetical protein
VKHSVIFILATRLLLTRITTAANHRNAGGEREISTNRCRQDVTIDCTILNCR